MPHTSTSTVTSEYRAEVLSVLLVVEPGLDGVFRHVEGLVDFLLGAGQRVHLAFSSRRSGAAMMALVERIKATGGSVMDMRIANTPELRDIPALASLVAMIRRVRPDIVHAHSSKAGAIARMAAVITGHRHCIYTPHAYYGMAKALTLKIRFFNRIEQVLARFGQTVAISADESRFAQDILKIPSDRLQVIHNPVDTARFTPATAEQRAAARVRLGMPANAIILATIGRMCWQKDPETAYKAAAPICQENPDVLFYHLGWGKWKNYLLEYSKELGFRSQLRILDYTDDPRSFYHAVDGILVSSRYEAGWPLVFLEALACDLPIVAAECPGMSDIAQAGLSHVWTFRAEDSAGCTAALHRWLSAQRSGQGQCNHRNFATERLSPQRCYGTLLEFYRGKPARTVSPLEKVEAQPLPNEGPLV